MSLIKIENLHIHCDPEKLDRILAGQAAIKETLMTLKQDLDTLISAMDAATTDIGNRIDKLSQQIKNNMTDDEVADVKAKMGAEVSKLQALGADPANPIPEPPAEA